MSLKLAELSIVVGTFNRLHQIKQCLESIVRETQTSFVIYITDAGSTDGTIEYLESISSEVIRPIFVGKLLGQAKAYNEVFAQVKTSFVCWISDDNVIVNGGLDIAVGILKEDRRIGMVGLKTRDIQGPFIDAPYIGGISEIGILNVNQGMLRTAVLKEVGGFSEAFRDYGIDPDLTAKVLFSGYDIVYTKLVSIHHCRNWGVDKSSPEYLRIKEKNERAKKLYILKYSIFAQPAMMLKIKQKALYKLKSRINGRGSVLRRQTRSSLARDFQNMLGGRFISILDWLYCYHDKFHLRQRCPKNLLPPSLPCDPEV